MATNAYNCFVRLAGELAHEVPKYNISASEIQLLRHIHGADAVVKVTHVGEFKDYNQETDLRKMAIEYGPNVVGRIFGVLPEVLIDDMDEDDKPEFISLEVIEREASGQHVDVRQVLKEARASQKAAPQKVDTGPYYANREAEEVDTSRAAE